MYVELTPNLTFMQFHDKLEDVCPENATTVIQITQALHDLIYDTKMSWQLAVIDKIKIYDVVDIDLFVELSPVVTKSPLDLMQDTITALQTQLATAQGAIDYIVCNY